VSPDPANTPPTPPAPPTPPLTGLRVLDVSMLGPGALGAHLADLGADVIKVEPPAGDYVRQMSWPIIDGASLLHWQVSRGKRSITLDLKSPAGAATFRQLTEKADAVVEAMRPGRLDHLGLGYADLRQVNPRLVMVTISGYGMTGPYASMPSHGIAYDAWAGLVQPAHDDDGYCYIPEHPSVGIHAGPLYGALALLAGVQRARDTGHGMHLEVAQSDAAAAMDWIRNAAWRAYERPGTEVTGNAADGYERRAPGTAGMEEGVRYQMYDSRDGAVLLMASERKFWRNLCKAIGRPDLFEAHPGADYADHARGNTALRSVLRDVFRTRTTAEWVALGIEHDVPISPVNTPRTISDDPQFKDRLPWTRPSPRGADLLPSPVRVVGSDPLPVGRAPELGEHTDQVLEELLGCDHRQIAELRRRGAFGRPPAPTTG
jgi:crotonobetainyl-CoA:carnitine CoA-transferase CaiB-like acyl-CoA transferase